MGLALFRFRTHAGLAVERASFGGDVRGLSSWERLACPFSRGAQLHMAAGRKISWHASLWPWLVGA